LLNVLAGHKGYARVTTIRSDSVMPGLLGMQRVRSEDAVRRAFLKGGPRGNLWVGLLATGSRIWGIDGVLIQPEME